MNSRRPSLVLVALLAVIIVVCAAAPAPAFGQRGPVARPTPRPAEEDEQVFTEEVRIPIFAYDEQGRFDPTLEIDDVLVVEEEVPQQVKSVRRIPASVLLLLGTGSELNPAVRLQTTRQIALNVVSNLREGDSVAAVQFNNRAEVIQGWTTDRTQAARTLRSKLAFGRGSRLSQALIRAAAYLREQPIGNRHLVVVTDGVEAPARFDPKDALLVLGIDTPETKAQAAEAVRQLIAAQTTLHIISYATIGKKTMKEREKPKESPGATQSRADIATVGIDPTLPPGMSRGGIHPPSVNTGLRIDPQLKKINKAYERAMKKGEDRLKSLTDETGGWLLLPTTDEEMIAEGADVAREIGAQYVVTYRPKRPLATAPATEYRRIRVSPRRIGLNLRARRGYVVGAMR
jgi:VWFA-related protein